MSVYKKLIEIQSELKAPKSQYNSFGKYNYRSCEDIQEALKPLLVKFGATLFIKDEIVLVDSRYYVKSIVTFVDIESGNIIESFAYARESEEKKGMDSAQVTGATSSYARKYALNGLFLLDDTKDNDHDSNYQSDVKKEELENKKEEKRKKDEIARKGKVVNDITSLLGDDIEKFNATIVYLNKKSNTDHKGLNDFDLNLLEAYLKHLQSKK